MRRLQRLVPGRKSDVGAATLFSRRIMQLRPLPFTSVVVKLTLQLTFLALATGAASHITPARSQLSSPIVGNFRTASISDPEVKMAAQFALKAQKKSVKPTLLAIERAQKQLVAGMNYQMTLKFKSGGTIQRAQAVVYRDLGGKFSLTSWAPSTPAKPAIKKYSNTVTEKRA